MFGYVRSRGGGYTGQRMLKMSGRKRKKGRPQRNFMDVVEMKENIQLMTVNLGNLTQKSLVMEPASGHLRNCTFTPGFFFTKSFYVALEILSQPCFPHSGYLILCCVQNSFLYLCLCLPDGPVIWRMLTYPPTRRALVVGCGLQMFQQLSGINTVM